MIWLPFVRSDVGVTAEIMLLSHLSTSQGNPTSIRIFLNAGSFFANLPAVSGVSSTLTCNTRTGSWHLWNQIIQLMQFSRYNKDFLMFSHYYSTEVLKCCCFQKILSLIKPDRWILPTTFCNNLQKALSSSVTFALMRTLLYCHYISLLC